MSDRKSVLVTDAGDASALAVIRSLGSAGWKVIAGDCDGRSLGGYSRFSGGSVRYPDPGAHPVAFAEFLNGLVRARIVDYVVPVTDVSILPLVAQRETFRDDALVLPSSDSLEVAWNKAETLRLASRVGIACPASRVVSRADDAVACAPEFGWPLVLKPVRSKQVGPAGTVEAFDVAYARDGADVHRVMRRYEGTCDVVVQPYVRGAGVGVAVLASGGSPVAMFQHERLREVPFTGGASSYRRSVPLDSDLREAATRIMRELGWNGLAMVEFKNTESGPLLMEVNGRVWGSLPLAVRSGVDFPSLLMNLHGRHWPSIRSAPVTDYRVGVRTSNLELEIIWMLGVLFARSEYPFLERPARSEVVGALASLLDPRNGLDVQSMRDPLPGVMEIPMILGKVWRKFLAAFGG